MKEWGLRGRRGTQKRIFFESLKCEPAQESSNARGWIMGTIVQKHGDDKEPNVDHHERRHKPRDPPLERRVILLATTNHTHRWRRSWWCRRHLILSLRQPRWIDKGGGGRDRMTNGVNHVVAASRWIYLNLDLVRRGRLPPLHHSRWIFPIF